MKNLTVIAMVAAMILLVPPARAEPLRDGDFIEVMKDNTLSGKTQTGINYNVYFLPGGEVTYEDQTGKVEHGAWSIDPDGDVCVKWTKSTAADDCFQVNVEGRNVSWKGKTGSGHGGLRGEVTSMTMAKSQ
jgi:hypothetical protein